MDEKVVPTEAVERVFRAVEEMYLDELYEELDAYPRYGREDTYLKYQFDGAENLAELVEMLHGTAAYLEGKAREGYELTAPVDGSWVWFATPDGAARESAVLARIDKLESEEAELDEAAALDDGKVDVPN